MNAEQSNKFATGIYKGVNIVCRYMQERSQMIETVLPKPETRARDSALVGLWLRARAWMQSLELLNHAKHYQAISSANRALLEIAVDMILLHFDKTNDSGEKLHWWGQSEKLKAAELMINYYAAQHLAVPDEYAPLVELYYSDKEFVDVMRRKYWPNPKDALKADHPKRWTGKSDLTKDIEIADRLYGNEIKADLGRTLEEFYRTEYKKMNWHIHSGVNSFHSISPEGFDLVCAFALKWCADFSMICTKIILRDFGFVDVLGTP